MHRGPGRNCNLVSRTEGQKVPRCLALTSPLSDSAIFLLRSMQRDECLIPISASQNVSQSSTSERTVEPVRASLPTIDLRTFILQQINIQFTPHKKKTQKTKNCVASKNNNDSKTTPGPEVTEIAAEKCGGFPGAKVCSALSCFPGEHRVCPLKLPSCD